MQSAELEFFSRRFYPFSSKAYHFGPLSPKFLYAIGKSISFPHTNRLEMIGNRLNWHFLVGVFPPFRQKRIILTFSIGCFDKQSEKAYYFRTRNSVLAMPFLGTDRAFVNHMPVYVFWQR
jgi:hypothetical protein